jgi:hypothetical protein
MTMSRTALDRLLAETLRADAAEAPMPEALLRVPNRWVRARAQGAPLRVVAAAGVMAAAVLATLAIVGILRSAGPSGIDVGGPPDAGPILTQLDPEPSVVDARDPEWPAATGPIVEIARGVADDRPFTITAFRTGPRPEVCIEFRWPFEVSFGCGGRPEATTSGVIGTGYASTGSAGEHATFGVVSSEVAEVIVEASSGVEFATQLVDLSSADMDGSLFIAFLPGGTDATAWVATDAAGRVLERFRLDVPAPTEPSGPMPTPAPS